VDRDVDRAQEGEEVNANAPQGDSLNPRENGVEVTSMRDSSPGTWTAPAHAESPSSAWSAN